ncbi:hypothetical protein RQP46_010371 [Phenoliferia psychrophenolica]
MMEYEAFLKKKETERDGLVFKVVMDSKGRTLEGSRDGDNFHHLEKVRKVFSGGLKTGLKIKTVTYFVNHRLECQFAEAKDALLRAGKPVNEVTLFHGTKEKNVQPIIQVSP